MAPTVLQIGAAYIRVSTDDQTELSPDAQLRVIKAEATRDGFVIPPEYIFVEHKGISGRKASNRPEFQRMISIAKSQSPAPFKRLYLWKFSRFARNQEESTFYKRYINKKSLFAFPCTQTFLLINLSIIQIYYPNLRFLLPKFHLLRYLCKGQSHQEY